MLLWRTRQGVGAQQLPEGVYKHIIGPGFGSPAPRNQSLCKLTLSIPPSPSSSLTSLLFLLRTYTPGALGLHCLVGLTFDLILQE